MSKKLIMLEVVAAFVMAVLVVVCLSLVAIGVGGNFMTDFTFLGERGYEAAGVFGIVFGLPLGGMLRVYVMKRRFMEVEQKNSSTLGIGLLVGIILLIIFFINMARGRNDQLRFNAGTHAIESMYPEMKNLDCFATCSYKYDKDGSNYYFAYIVHGSGVPIVKASCFKFDKDSVVTRVGEFPSQSDSHNGFTDINPKKL